MNYIETISKENGRCGRMYVEKYLLKNYQDIHAEIINYCNEKLSDILFKEKVYHYVHNIKEKVLCKNSNCTNETKYHNSTLGYYDYCSIQCISSDQKIKDIKEKKSFEKYGTKAPGMNSDVKEKTIKTNQERYGSNSPLQNISIKKKSQDTLFKNYGVDNPNKSAEILIRRIKSFKKSNFKENYLKTMMNRYGVKYPYQNEDILNKSKNTLLKNYGVKYPYQNEDILIKTQEKRKETWIKNKISNNINIIEINYDSKEYLMKCDNNENHIFKISFDLFDSRNQFAKYKCTVCFPEHFNQSSMVEHDLLKFIKNYVNEITENSKKIIEPYELDIYLPDLKLAFEFNGLYWHSELYKGDNYHFNKTESCERQGIRLIHIYEDDWMYKQEIVKSRILNLLGQIPNKIYARKCEIKEISDNNILRDFLETNHIQGFVGSQVRIGLFYNDELVSLMTFGKQRKSMGIKCEDNTYEMLRFCNKLNTSVVGGASKLFKYFIQKYDPIEIISYADRSWSSGDLYKQLGFDLVHKTKPNYYYVVDGIRKYRFLFRKDVLIKQGFNPNKTEREIMLEREIYRIYDSGSMKFIYNKK